MFPIVYAYTMHDIYVPNTFPILYAYTMHDIYVPNTFPIIYAYTMHDIYVYLIHVSHYIATHIPCVM